MIQIGTILNIENHQAILFTEQCDIVRIKRQPGMYQGLELQFDSSEIIGAKNIITHNSPLVGCVAALIIFVFLIANFLLLDKSPTYALIEISTDDIGIEFYVDKNNKVLDSKKIDGDSGLSSDEFDIRSEPLESALMHILKNSDSLNTLESVKRSPILIATHITKRGNSKNNAQRLKAICDDAVRSYENLEPYIVGVTRNDKVLSAKNDISMGRYMIYKMALAQDIELTVNYVKTAKISDILQVFQDKGGSLEDTSGVTSTQTVIPTNNNLPTPNSISSNTYPSPPESPLPTATPSAMPSISQVAPTHTPGTTPLQPIIATPTHIHVTPSKPAIVPTRTPKPTPFKPVTPPTHTPFITPYNRKTPTQIDPVINVQYDISIIETIEKEIEKAETKIETIKESTTFAIRQEIYNAKIRTEEIDNNNYFNWRKIQIEKDIIESELNSKIQSIKQNEKEQIADVLDNLYKKIGKLTK